MNMNGIETQYQNYAVSGNFSTKSSRSEGTFDIFKKEILNWKKRMKETLDKEQENDSKGIIQMSERQWSNLMKKVDTAIDTSKDYNNEMEQEKDTSAVSSKSDKTNMQFFDPKLVQLPGYTALFLGSEKKDKELI